MKPTPVIQIPRRARLCDSTGCRYLRTLHREEAQKLLSAGIIAVDEMSGTRIVSFRLSGVAVLTTLRAGSFGVRREHVPVNRQYGLSGGVVFSHHDLHERAAA